MIGVSVCVPSFSSKNLRSSGKDSPKVVPSIAVIVKSAVPTVVNLTFHSPPTVG